MEPTSPPVTVEEGQRRILACARPLSRERVSATDPGVGGRVLAVDVFSFRDLPPSPVSVMDGWAVRVADVLGRAGGDPRARVRLTRAGESAAGHPAARSLPAGAAMRISTGAVIPADADAVIAQEDTRIVETDDGAADLELDLERVGALRPGLFIRQAGSDVRKHALLCGAGVSLGPGELALLCSAGHDAFAVHRRPRVAILCSGDELVAIGRSPRPGQIVSTNGLMLAHQIREAGGVPVDLGVAPDEPTQLQAALARGLEADALVTSGGISVGDHDLVHACLEALGFEALFRRVNLKPGRPTTCGRTPGGALVFALPGNPASSMVAFELLVRPALRKLQGHAEPRWRRPRLTVALTHPLPAAGRRDSYLRAQVYRDASGWCASALRSQASGALRSISETNALLVIPGGTPARPIGARVEALVTGPLPAPAEGTWTIRHEREPREP